MGLFDSIGSIFTGGGALGSVVRTVAMGYVLNKVTASATKGNNIGSSISSGPGAPGIDNGVRLQVEPGSDQKIPILYGSAVFGGITTEAVMSNNNQRMHYVLTFAEKTGTLLSNSSATSYSVQNVYWDDNEVYFKADGVTIDYTIDRQGNRSENLQDLVKIYFYAGGSASANQIFPNGYSGTSANAYSIVSGWNSAYQMSDLIFAVAEVNYSAERNIKGLGDVQVKFSTNLVKPGDVIYDYLTNSRYGANIASADINTTSLTALNSYSAETIDYEDETLGNVTLANRYQINGLINTEQPVMQNLEDIASASGSWLSYDVIEGEWGVIINQSGNSVASFGDSNIIGGISISGTGLEDLYNSVKIEFPHRDIRDTTDFIKIDIPIADRNANEQDNTLNIAYNYVNEPVQAQLLGFIELKQSRVDLVITFNTDYTILNLNAGDIIDVTNSQLGFTNKKFRIITISESSDDDQLINQIVALEYDDTVYDETNLYRYTRTLSNGLTQAGNIGIPGTPTITSYETDARPRIEVSTVTPTGTVEGMEFWLSNDTGVGEAQRSYRLIATEVPENGNANVRGTYTTGETVTLDYDTIGTSNFVIKTRAYNATTVGPFSSNSAITSFTATQATDAILPTTVAYDELGGLATTLGIITLLNSLDDLFGNSATGSGGIFDTIKDIFFPGAPEGETSAESILTQSNSFQANINDSITSAITDPAFIANVSQFTSNLNAYSVNELGDVDTGNISPILNDVLAWDGSQWRPAQTCCPSLTYREPAPGDPGYVEPPVAPVFLNRYATWPNDITNTYTEEVTGPGNVVVEAPTLFDYLPHGELAPQTGSYYAWFKNTANAAIYSDLFVGSGDVELYKSDGTLVETLTAGDLIIDKNRVEFPFADREYSTNYYILMDAGVVKYCPDSPVDSPAITDPTIWNFNTPFYETGAYANVTPGSLDTLAPPSVSNVALTVTSINWGNLTCPNSNLIISFSENVTNNSGVVSISDDGGIVANLAGASATVVGNTMDFGPVANIAYSTIYNITVPQGLARTIRSDSTNYSCGTWANTAAQQAYSTVSTKTIETKDELVLVSYSLTEQDLTGNVITEAPYTSASIESILTLTFNRPIYRADGDPLNITIYEGDGTIHQAFDLNTSFANDKTSEIISMAEGGTTITMNPTRDFLAFTDYYCLIPNNVIKDDCGVNFSGISNTSTITWSTIGYGISTVEPALSSTGRTVNETGINATFGQPVTPGYGRLKIINSANVEVANISSTNGNITYS